jgi:hypothetical protein
MDHPQLWGPWFRDPATWAPWRAFVGALFGLPLDGDALDVFQRCTGRTAPPAGGSNEAWLICGRRAGKSFILALIAVYLAVFRDWRAHLSPGEVGMIKVIAVDRKQARVIARYCRALLSEVPTLASLVERDNDDEIVLSNGIIIDIQTASFRTVRGFTVIAALCDEIAFWRSEDSAANPDSEILAALRPSMATVPNAMLLCASSPYARRGELYSHFNRFYAQDDAPALIWRAATRVMNSTVPQRVIDDATTRDPARAAAEYGAEFRVDIESFIAREVVEAAIAPGRHELPPLPGVVYTAFVDPSGGSADAFTLAVAHAEREGRVILDCIRERRPPFSPEAVTAEYAQTLKSYRCQTCRGDRYGGQWPAEQFAKHGIEYQAAAKPKTDLYSEVLPLLNGGRVELLDHPRLVAQLCGLERRTARGGRDSIDHAPGSHDDIVNAVAGALCVAAGADDSVAMATPVLVTRPLEAALGLDSGANYAAYEASLGIRRPAWSGGSRDEWSCNY